MEKVELYVTLLGISYAFCILGLWMALNEESTETILIIIVFTMVLTCPWYVFFELNLMRMWDGIAYMCMHNSLFSSTRLIREWDERRKIVVVPQKKKKKIDIAKPTETAKVRTQAEIIEEQRRKVKEMHGVQKKDEKKKEKNKPKRKGPPKDQNNEKEKEKKKKYIV